MLAKRVEASISGRTFAAALQTDLARANLKLTVGEFLIMQIGRRRRRGHARLADVGDAVRRRASSARWAGSCPKFWLGRRQSGRLKAFNDQLARHDRADEQLAALGHEPGAVDGNDLARSRAADLRRVPARRARDRSGRRPAGSAAAPGAARRQSTTSSCW